MRTKFTIVVLLAVIVASTISVAGHFDVFLPVQTFEQKEIPLPPRSFNASPMPAPISRGATEAPLQKPNTPEGTFITLVVGDKTYHASATSTRTILQVMRTLENTTDLSFSGTEFSGLGFFVEEIDHKKNAGGYYWMLYVNMLAAQKGVSQTLVSPGDVVLWRYEKNRHAI